MSGHVVALQAQKLVVNAGASSGLFSSGPGLTLLCQWFDSCARAGV